MYTYHAPSNTVREKPKIPNPIDMTDFLAYVGVYGEVVIDAAIAAYKKHVESLQSFPVEGKHEWKDGRELEEGKDFTLEPDDIGGFGEFKPALIAIPLQPEVSEAGHIQPPVFGEWQLCPKCNGNKKMLVLYFGIFQEQTCGICNGAGILPRPIINDKKQSGMTKEQSNKTQSRTGHVSVVFVLEEKIAVLVRALEDAKETFADILEADPKNFAANHGIKLIDKTLSQYNQHNT